MHENPKWLWDADMKINKYRKDIGWQINIRDSTDSRCFGFWCMLIFFMTESELILFCWKKYLEFMFSFSFSPIVLIPDTIVNYRDNSTTYMWIARNRKIFMNLFYLVTHFLSPSLLVFYCFYQRGNSLNFTYRKD